jgi:hypothetical protein
MKKPKPLAEVKRTIKARAHAEQAPKPKKR